MITSDVSKFENNNNHVFISSSYKYNGKGTCKYISYLLCEKIRDKIPGKCDEGIFNMLKEFLEEYNVYNSSNICKNNFKPLDENEFLKMKALYQLYDRYIQLSPIYAHRHDNYCHNMLHLVYLYNTFFI
ncbi:CYIR protein [Plasmodium cynomolgi strain B]|uniref:CYIR protein n=1 Tax=Plasmodium cynomolgi (strain B) TaxID=1120755 RepID=K6UNT2_PLACD|nr:CYIR protein [Plasmodium cynomolgi strain B]GAB69783.1 CYIR protein [Plasmodium cynomolgi strain B]